MPPFGSLSLFNGLPVLVDRHIDDLRLSLCRLFRFVVLRHGVVNGIARHRTRRRADSRTHEPPLDVAELLTVWLMTVVFFFTTVVRFGA